MRCRFAALTSLALAACSAAPEPTRPPLEDATFAALQTMRFAGADAVLTGFAPPDDDAAMREGDAALLGVEVRRDGTIERQLLLLEVARIPWERATGLTVDGFPQKNGEYFVRPVHTFTVTSKKTVRRPGEEPTVTTEQRTQQMRSLHMRLQRLDDAGKPLQSSDATLFEEPLATGFWPYANRDPEPRDADLALALTMSLQELATKDDVLQDLLFRVVEKPSLWAIATNLGVAVTLQWSTANAGEPAVSFPGFPDEVGRASLDLIVNGKTAAWVTLFAARPHAGTAACGGLVGAIAQHPTDPGRFALVRLLATRRGKKA